MKKAILLFIAIFAVACSNNPSDTGNKKETPYQLPHICPPYLKMGDSIGIATISSRNYFSPEKCDSLIKAVEAWGFKVKVAKHVFDSTGGWFPASDAERAADLQEMLDNRNIRAVVFFRGGYGAVRTLDYLNLMSLRKDPKWLVGYSDLTVMHYALRKINVESIHGTMPVSFKLGTNDESANSVREALLGNIKEYNLPADPLNQFGEAQGVIVGGNLSIIVGLNGTDVDFEQFTEPYILLIEDVEEALYSIDRMMQNLKRSGKLKNAKAIIFGNFTNISKQEPWKKTTQEVLKEYTKDLKIPVIFNFPAGHSAPNLSVYMGRTVKISVSNSGSKVQF